MPTLIHHRHIINLHTARCSDPRRTNRCVIHSGDVGEERRCDHRSVSRAGAAGARRLFFFN